MAIEYKNFTNPVAQKGNMGGIKQEVYFARRDDFASLAAKPDPDTNPDLGDLNKLTVGTDTLKPGKKLYRFYNTREKGGLVAERQGEADAVSHKITLKVFTPGLQAEVLGMLNIPNDEFIFYVPSGNQIFRLGNSDYAAKLEPTGSTGTGDTTASAKGSELTFAAYEVGYAGEVVDKDAILAMLIAEDAALTATFDPAHGSIGVLVTKSPTITFSKAVVNADTMLAFTALQIEDAVVLEKYDVNGDLLATGIAFVASISGNVWTINPTADFAAASIYQVKFNASKVIAGDSYGRVTGSNLSRFITA